MRHTVEVFDGDKWNVVFQTGSANTTDSAWTPPVVEDPSVTLPAVFTGVLIATCAPVYGAVRAAREGRRWAAWALIAVAFAVQATYLGLQISLFVDDINSFSPTQTAYGSIYFALLGIHHVHVAVGLLLEAWLLGVLAFGLTNYRLLALRVIAMYWYFVADPREAVEQVRRLIADRGVRTICVHGDNLQAVAFVRAVRDELLRAGAELRPFA